jgi:hypothetical protein
VTSMTSSSMRLARKQLNLIQSRHAEVVRKERNGMESELAAVRNPVRGEK